MIEVRKCTKTSTRTRSTNECGVIMLLPYKGIYALLRIGGRASEPTPDQFFN